MLGDGRGGAIHLGERDRSLQRRYEKIWEEGALAVVLAAAARAKIGATCAKAMQDMKYLVSAPSNFSTRTASFISSK